MGNSRKLARRLLKQNRGTASITARSWRVIARDDYQNKIPAGTLCRFAIADGGWLPKDEYQIALGLKKQRAVTHHVKSIFDMSTDDLRNALINRQPMPKIVPAMKRMFKQLGYRNIRTGPR